MRAAPSTAALRLRGAGRRATLARMAIVLHRFPLSHFSEKVRAALDFKGLDYKLVEHDQGAGQLAVYRLSGQRKVPVLEHDGQVIADSTTIALHLERAYPARDGHRALLPDDIRQRRAVLDLEDRIDDTLGAHVVTVALGYAVHDRALFDALARAVLHVDGAGLRAARGIGLASRAALLLPSARRRMDDARYAVETMLTELAERLERTPFLLGDTPTLADVAAVGLTLLLKFPHSRDLAVPALAGRGATALFEDPRFRRFFTWRDAFYREFLK